MHRAAPAVLSLLIALILRSSSALAQDWSQPWADPMDRPPRVDVSASGGFLMATRWSDLVVLGSATPVSGALQQVLTRDVHIEPHSAFTGGVTYWRSRYGFRAHAGFSRSSLQISSEPIGSNATASAAGIIGNVTSVGINTWLYDVGAAIGFIDYAPSRPVWPYGFVGVGGITYDLKQTIAPPLTFIDHPPSRPASTGDTIIVSDGRQFLITTNALSTETTFAFNIGLGTDFRIPLGAGGVGVRVELADHIAPSPLAVRVEELSPFGLAGSDTGARYRIVHHMSATAGLVLQFGR